ncbi:tRNA glutamyl-Q(34) synthetase GluQRS [Pseudomonas sp. HK3]
MNNIQTPYIGRFAPTPTGPLHFGSLVTALASYLDAKAHQGTWLLRIEDLDPPREDPAASSRIPEQLSQHGLHWDDDIQFQSQHYEHYEHVLAQLSRSGFTFPCQCSRKQLFHNQGLHQGICSAQRLDTPSATRLQVPDTVFGIHDRVFGHYQQSLRHDVGDQVLKRKDGLYAYQLAVVADDHTSNITHVVRGVDLLDNTPRQLYLMQCLDYEVPQYLHVPLAINNQGQKLSKQNHATAIEGKDAKNNVLTALSFLQQDVTSAMRTYSIDDALKQAIENWQPSRIQPNHAGLI